MLICDCSVADDFAGPKLAAVPGHVGMVPGQPSQARTIRTDTRRRAKVITGDQHLGLAVSERYRDQSIHCLSIVLAVICAHTDQAIPALVNRKVGIAQPRIRTALAD